MQSLLFSGLGGVCVLFCFVLRLTNRKTIQYSVTKVQDWDFLSALAAVNESPWKSDLGPAKQGGTLLPRIVFRIDFKGIEWSFYDLQLVHSGKKYNLREYGKGKKNPQVSCTGIYCRLVENSQNCG